MMCTMCKYEWCWTCGFAKKSAFHYYTGNGFLCKLFNAFVFGFECGTLHWTLRSIITLLGFVATPALILLFLIGMFVFLIYNKGCNEGRNMYICFRRRVSNKNCCVNTLSFLAIAIFSMVEFGLILTLATIIGSIIYAIVIVPILLYLIFFVLVVIYQ